MMNKKMIVVLTAAVLLAGCGGGSRGADAGSGDTASGGGTNGGTTSGGSTSGGTTSGGTTSKWASVKIGGGYVPGVIFHPTSPNVPYARTDVGGAYRWNAQTSSWIAITDGFGPSEGFYMHRSNDAGKTWAGVTTPVTGSHIPHMVRAADGVVYVCLHPWRRAWRQGSGVARHA